MVSRVLKEDRRLWVALGCSFVLHAALLSLQFSPLDATVSKPLQSSLEIILVNARHDKAPIKADALAQANFAGGGNAELGRARSPLPDLQQSVDGNHHETQHKKIAELEKQNIDLLEEVVDALRDVVFFVPRPTTTSAHADKVLPRYEQQLKKARGEV